MRTDCDSFVHAVDATLDDVGHRTARDAQSETDQFVVAINDLSAHRTSNFSIDKFLADSGHCLNRLWLDDRRIISGIF